MTAALPDDRVQLRASLGGRDEAHQAIEAAIEVGLVDLQRAVREPAVRLPLLRCETAAFRPVVRKV